MTTAELQNLIAGSEGRLCMRLYRRADGTLLSKDCPVGVRINHRRASAFVGAAFAAILGFFSFAYGQKDETITKIDAKRLEILRRENKGVGVMVAGRIVDANGMVVPAVTVQLRRDGEVVETLSDDEGEFSFERLKSGGYEMHVGGIEGFQKTVIQNLEVRPYERLELSVTLEVAPVVEYLLGVVDLKEPEPVITLETSLPNQTIELIPIVPLPKTSRRKP